MADEKIYTVPLRRGFLKAKNYDRARKSVVVLKTFLKKHTKKDVKIGKYLNLELWKRGRKHPPGKVKIRVEGEEDNIIAELIDAPREEKVEKKEDKISIKKPKILGGKTKDEKVTEEIKEETKKAIEKVPERGIKEVDSDKREAEPVEKKHEHRKEERVITQRTGKFKSRIS